MKKDSQLYGSRPVLEALKSKQEFEKILLQNGLKSPVVSEIQHLAKEQNIPVQWVPEEKLNRMTQGNHQGVIATISPIQYQPLEEIVTRVFEEGETPFLLILDRVTDVRNMGAIARTAECAGVHALILPSQGSAALNDDAIKTSAGALLRLPICREINLKTTLNYLKQSGIKLFAASEKSSRNYTLADYNEPLAIIMGSEENGVSPEYLKMCDARLCIPLAGEIESLNVSVACGILLFEAVRQRNI